VVAPPVSIKNHVILALPMSIKDRMSGFMGPCKLSSLVTILSNRTSLDRGGLWRENVVAQDDGRVRRSLRTKIVVVYA
jgi:hypothetical protein